MSQATISQSASTVITDVSTNQPSSSVGCVVFPGLAAVIARTATCLTGLALLSIFALVCRRSFQNSFLSFLQYLHAVGVTKSLLCFFPSSIQNDGQVLKILVHSLASQANSSRSIPIPFDLRPGLALRSHQVGWLLLQICQQK